MNDILKGNFKTKIPVTAPVADKENSLEERFEREAFKRLGGSIAFVAKQKVVWDDNDLKKAK